MSEQDETNAAKARALRAEAECKRLREERDSLRRAVENPAMHELGTEAERLREELRTAENDRDDLAELVRVLRKERDALAFEVGHHKPGHRVWKAKAKGLREALEQANDLVEGELTISPGRVVKLRQIFDDALDQEGEKWGTPEVCTCAREDRPGTNIPERISDDPDCPVHGSDQEGEKCPTCGSDEPGVRLRVTADWLYNGERCGVTVTKDCPDPWHSSPDQEGEKFRCPRCGNMVDTPQHELGCPEGE